MAAPLDGIRILEVANWAAAPCAVAIMADMGAEVIKVEPTRGDSMRGTLRQAVMAEGEVNPDHPFQFANRGKKSIAVDLRTDEGAGLVRRLAGHVDIFLTNLMASRRERFGLTAEDIFAVKPSLVYATFTGYGESGPDASKPGFDTTAFFSRGGVASVIPGPDGAPPRFRPGQGDHAAGLGLLSGVLAALRMKEQTGEGQVVEASLIATATWTLAMDLAPCVVDHRQPSHRSRYETVSHTMEAYRCRDGRWVQIMMAHPDKGWKRLCEALGREDLITHPDFATAKARFAHPRMVTETLDAEFAKRTHDEWATILDEHRCIWAPVSELPEVVEDPQVRAAGAFETIHHPTAGDFDTIAAPFRLPRTDMGVRGPAPEVGEHTTEVLGGILGLDPEEVADLAERGVVNPSTDSH